MNLINEMLCSLDKRKNVFVAPGYLQWHHILAQARPWKMAILVFTGILAGFHFYGQTTASEVVSREFSKQPQQLAESSKEAVIIWVGGENRTKHGLEIKFFVSEQIMVKILDQSGSYLRLLFAGADEMDVSSMRLAGISSYQSTDGINIEIDLDQAAEFKVYQNYHADQFTIIVAMKM